MRGKTNRSSRVRREMNSLQTGGFCSQAVADLVFWMSVRKGGECGAQCPGRVVNDLMFMHLLAGCTLEGFNLPSVNALSLALFSRTK